MKIIFIKTTITLLCLISACSRMETYTALDETPDILPDYSNVVIPPNIAPLNFYIQGNDKRYLVRFIARSDSFDVYSKNNVNIPAKKWKRLLTENVGQKLTIRIFSKKETGWVKYSDLSMDIAVDKIDPDRKSVV